MPSAKGQTAIITNVNGHSNNIGQKLPNMWMCIQSIKRKDTFAAYKTTTKTISTVFSCSFNCNYQHFCRKTKTHSSLLRRNVCSFTTLHCGVIQCKKQKRNKKTKKQTNSKTKSKQKQRKLHHTLWCLHNNKVLCVLCTELSWAEPF